MSDTVYIAISVSNINYRFIYTLYKTYLCFVSITYGDIIIYSLL